MRRILADSQTNVIGGLFLVILLVLGCSDSPLTPPATPDPRIDQLISSLNDQSQSLSALNAFVYATPTVSPTPTPTRTAVPTAAATPDPRIGVLMSDIELLKTEVRVLIQLLSATDTPTPTPPATNIPTETASPGTTGIPRVLDKVFW